jgi:hypothetical protein
MSNAARWLPVILLAGATLARAADPVTVAPVAAATAAPAPAAATATTLPLRDGERLVYRVSWAFMLGAGEIIVDARHDAAANPRLIVTTTTATRGFIARGLLKFDARAESIFDLQTGRLLSLHELSQQRSKSSEHSVTFDYAKRQATYTVPTATEAPRVIDIPPGDPVDLIIGLLQTRTWNLKEGETRDALVLFKDDFYELTIHAARYENVETSLGMFRTLVLEPRMDKTPPKGMFARGSSVRVWISQDERRLPVRFEVEFTIGTGTATLEAYTPPTVQPAAPTPAKVDEKNSRP